MKEYDFATETVGMKGIREWVVRMRHLDDKGRVQELRSRAKKSRRQERNQG